jgi:hypothetical protein
MMVSAVTVRLLTQHTIHAPATAAHLAAASAVSAPALVLL